MDSSPLAIMNFTPEKRTSYSVPDGKGGSVEITVGEVITIDGQEYEVLEPEEPGKLYVKPITVN